MSHNIPSNVTSNSVQIVAKQKKKYVKIWITMSILYFWMKLALPNSLQIACIVFNVYKSMDSFCKHIFPLINMYKTILVGVYRGAHPPPPSLPEMTYGFLIQLVFCKIWRYMWYLFSAVHIILLGTLSNDDDDNNVKEHLVLRAKQLLCTCITLFSTFLWLLFHDYDVKPPNAMIYGGGGHTTTNLALKNSTPGKVAYIPNRRDKVWKDANSFF